MIGISFSRKDFEYDAYTLIKAFYPKEDVVTFYEGDEKEKDTYSFLVRILYEEDCTTILFEKESNCIFQETVHFPEEEERKERALYRKEQQEKEEKRIKDFQEMINKWTSMEFGCR